MWCASSGASGGAPAAPCPHARPARVCSPSAVSWPPSRAPPRPYLPRRPAPWRTAKRHLIALRHGCCCAVGHLLGTCLRTERIKLAPARVCDLPPPAARAAPCRVVLVRCWCAAAHTEPPDSVAAAALGSATRGAPNAASRPPHQRWVVSQEEIGRCPWAAGRRRLPCPI